MVGPSVPRSHPRDLMQGARTYEVIEGDSQSPREITSILVRGGAKQVKITTNHQGERTSFYFIGDFVQKNGREGVVSGAIYNHKFPERVKLSMEKHSASPKDTMIKSNKIKNIPFRT